MAATVFVKQVFHVLKEFHVASLVTGNSDPLNIFFNGTFHNFSNTPVMPQMDDLCTLGLHDPAHDIDSSIMPVEQGSSSYDTNLILKYKSHNQLAIIFLFCTEAKSKITD